MTQYAGRFMRFSGFCCRCLAPLAAHGAGASRMPGADGEGLFGLSRAPHHEAGEVGPENPKYQCPVSIDTASVKAAAEPFELRLEDDALEVLHTGHTIQVSFEGRSSLSRGGRVWHLVQLHFHTPSETCFDGAAFPMETHFVFSDDDGRLLVLGAFAAESASGTENPALATLLASAPDEAEDPVPIHGWHPDALLPADRHFYAFPGSLTTPPYTEPVDWIVYQAPAQASRAQLEAMAAILGDNTRPVQPLNGRPIKEGR